jgi:hypothetical protein
VTRSVAHVPGLIVAVFASMPWPSIASACGIFPVFCTLKT